MEYIKIEKKKPFILLIFIFILEIYKVLNGDDVDHDDDDDDDDERY
jgi:hypothetical protein